jgi:hypothetical protein
MADLVALGRFEKMMKQTRCYGCDKPIEPEWLTEGEFIICDECYSDIDELLVKKLQEQLNTAEKALIEISSTRQEVWRGGTLVGLELTEDAKIAFEALAAIGGDDEQ